MKKFRNLFEKSDPCWKGYEMVGMKDKNGKKVPNCVPVKESLEEQIQLLDEMPGANMDTRAVHQHLKKQGWSLSRTSGGHDVFTHPEAKHHIPVPRHRQLKAPLVKGILKQSQMREEIEQIDELDKSTLQSYKRKAEISQDFAKKRLAAATDSNNPKAADSAAKDVVNRRYGLKAVKKRLGENMQMDESDVSNPHQAAITHHHTELMKTFKSGDTAARAHHEKELNSAKERFRAHRAANTPAPAPAKPGSIGHYYANATRTNDSVEVDGDVLSEGRPSQRHPLEGHDYHKKSNAELEYIAKDAHKAAEAMKSHNTAAENKYRDQANDSATVRYYRQKHGMQPWYKKKYGHVNEEVVAEGKEDNIKQLRQDHATAVHWSKNDTNPHKREAARQKAEKIKGHLEKQYKQGVAEGAPIVVMPSPERLKKPESIKVRYQGDIIPSTQPPSTEKRGVKGRPGQRPMPNQDVAEGKKPGHLNPGWMLKADPKLGAKVDANKKKFKAFKQNVGKKIEDKKDIKEDNVINTNADNSIDGVKPATQNNIVKKKQVVDRYTTGASSGVSGTTVVASPRNESVQESVAMDIAKMAARRNAGLKEANNDNTLSSYDKDDTPAKKSLSKTAGMVKDLADKAKGKAKGKKSDDTFQPEPELASNIVR